VSRRILFVCVENSCRSQMAEAFARRAGADAHSAGSRPSGVVNARAIASMAEVGYDLAGHRSQSLADVPPGAWDLVVTMGCGDSAAAVPARERLDWAVPDPKEMEPAAFGRVRDRIRDEVEKLLR